MKVPRKKEKKIAVEVAGAGAGATGSGGGGSTDETPVDKKVPPLPGTAVERLRYFGHLSGHQQVSYLTAINEAFLEFLNTDPSREEFCEVMHGVLITSLMLWTAMKAHR